jgi:hypothetical protein
MMPAIIISLSSFSIHPISFENAVDCLSSSMNSREAI